MSNRHIVLLLVGAIVVSPAWPALSSESMSSVVRTAAQAKNFAAYLPATPSQAPWLSLDARTKLPKGDFPLGRQANGIGPLVLPVVLPTQVTANERTGTIFERRM